MRVSAPEHVVSFADRRRGDQDELEKTLFPFVQQAMDAYPVEGWYNDLLQEVARTYLEVFRREGGRTPVKPTAAEFTDSLKPTLDKTEDPDHNTTERVSVWLATAILNAATQAAAAQDEEFLVLEWVTMHDEAVRDAHRRLNGMQRPPGEPFEADGCTLRYPGDSSGDPGCWMNCRCALAPVLGEEATFASSSAHPRVHAGTTSALPGGSDHDPVGVPVLTGTGAGGDGTRGVPG